MFSDSFAGKIHRIGAIDMHHVSTRVEADDGGSLVDRCADAHIVSFICSF